MGYRTLGKARADIEWPLELRKQIFPGIFSSAMYYSIPNKYNCGIQFKKQELLAKDSKNGCKHAILNFLVMLYHLV